MATNLFQIKSQISYLCSVLEEYLSKEEIELVKKAHKIAEKAHSGQFRKSGEPYISHPLSVALILAELKLDYFCIVAAILHDCIEDTSVTKDDVRNQFGEQVAHIVEGVSKLTNLEFTSSTQKQAQNFQKLILAMSKDMRVMIIKLYSNTMEPQPLCNRRMKLRGFFCFLNFFFFTHRVNGSHIMEPISKLDNHYSHVF